MCILYWLEKAVDIVPIFLSRNFYVFIEFSYISARLPVPAMRLYKGKFFIGVSNFFYISLLCIHARNKHFLLAL
jgi:hypothetical protein